MHPQFKTRLAGIYIEKAIEDGDEEAVEWATEFLSKEHRREVYREVRKIVGDDEE